LGLDERAFMGRGVDLGERYASYASPVSILLVVIVVSSFSLSAIPNVPTLVPTGGSDMPTSSQLDARCLVDDCQC
jgi:hypothetical protein